jgi:lipopolysaccharide export system permease protein
MKLLTRYIIKEHFGPFLFSLAVIMFILLMNFLVKYIDLLFGRGLPWETVLKLILFNLAWMSALAVPMATLVSVLMAFGRLSADNEITILKSSGISIYRIISPAIMYGIILTIVMVWFNDRILPEANHAASSLLRSIRDKKPTLQMEEHVFTSIGKFTFVIEEIEKPFPEEWPRLSASLGYEYADMEQIDRLKNVIIFDRSDIAKDITILAKEGYMVYSKEKEALAFTLFTGEFHELENNKYSKYKKSEFTKQVVYIPADGFEFEERQSNYRGDREMNIAMMRKKVQTAETKMIKQYEKIETNHTDFFHKTIRLLDDSTLFATDSASLPQIIPSQLNDARRRAVKEAKYREQKMKNHLSYIKNFKKTINQYEVEIQKKISIPFASIVFVLVGAPLGVMAKKGSKGIAISMSMAFFLLYWTFLIGGEDLADRRIISPFIAMWSANIIIGLAGMYLIWRAVKESSFIKWEKLDAFKQKIQNIKIFG